MVAGLLAATPPLTTPNAKPPTPVRTSPPRPQPRDAGLIVRHTDGQSSVSAPAQRLERAGCSVADTRQQKDFRVGLLPRVGVRAETRRGAAHCTGSANSPPPRLLSWRAFVRRTAPVFGRRGPDRFEPAAHVHFLAAAFVSVAVASSVVGKPLITQIAFGRSMVWVSRSSLTNLMMLSVKSVPL